MMSATKINARRRTVQGPTCTSLSLRKVSNGCLGHRRDDQRLNPALVGLCCEAEVLELWLCHFGISIEKPEHF
jgi:hypothetical protein